MSNFHSVGTKVKHPELGVGIVIFTVGDDYVGGEERSWIWWNKIGNDPKPYYFPVGRDGVPFQSVSKAESAWIDMKYSEILESLETV